MAIACGCVQSFACIAITVLPADVLVSGKICSNVLHNEIETHGVEVENLACAEAGWCEIGFAKVQKWRAMDKSGSFRRSFAIAFAWSPTDGPVYARASHDTGYDAYDMSNTRRSESFPRSIRRRRMTTG
jgi:hypothetical protein